MRATCRECGRLRRNCKNVETDRVPGVLSKFALCRACRKTWRLEYPEGAELENVLRAAPAS